MEIKFEQQGLLYVAEIEVASNCNLHIERESRGAFTIAQRGTKQGKYAYITDENYDNRTIIDVDMLGNIYPKYIKITSVSRPTYAEVNFAEQGGGGNSGGGNIEYYKIDENLLSSFDDDTVNIFTMFPTMLNMDAPDSGLMVASTSMFLWSFSVQSLLEILQASQGIAIYTDVSVGMAFQEVTFNDYIAMENIDTSNWQKITKEEFYNIIEA